MQTLALQAAEPASAPEVPATFGKVVPGRGTGQAPRTGIDHGGHSVVNGSWRVRKRLLDRRRTTINTVKMKKSVKLLQAKIVMTMTGCWCVWSFRSGQSRTQDVGRKKTEEDEKEENEEEDKDKEEEGTKKTMRTKKRKKTEGGGAKTRAK